jgi:hypothetical protein
MYIFVNIIYIFLKYYKKTMESNIYDLLDVFTKSSLTDKIWFFFIIATVKLIYNCLHLQIAVKSFYLH